MERMIIKKWSGLIQVISICRLAFIAYCIHFKIWCCKNGIQSSHLLILSPRYSFVPILILRSGRYSSWWSCVASCLLTHWQMIRSKRCSCIFVAWNIHCGGAHRRAQFNRYSFTFRSNSIFIGILIGRSRWMIFNSSGCVFWGDFIFYNKK